jgi:drug/metabolite transporter (DMT)-like permease
VNEGIITSVWAVTPLFGALLDYFAFGEKLSRKHLIGVFSLVGCAALISLSSITNQVSDISGTFTVAPWVPVAMAIMGSVFMSIRSLQCK